MRLADVAGWYLHPPAEYIVGTRPDDGKRTVEDLSSGEVQAFLLEHPEVTTRSAKVQRALAFIHSFHRNG